MWALRQDHTFSKTLVIVLAGSMFAGMVMLCLFFASELARLAIENQKLDSEKRAMSLRLDAIEEKFRKINAYNDTLDELTLSTVSGDAEMVEEQSEKITSIRRMLDKLSKFHSDREAERNMIHRVDTLAANANRLERTLRHIVSILGHHREILDFTPTLTPATGWISSFFGERRSPFTGEEVVHNGLDIGAEDGSPVFAPAAGHVGRVGKSPSLGNFIEIEHAYGIKTRYGHNSAVTVQKGDTVRRGQKIAEVGSTGRSTGPHLHYEVWVDNKPVNPRDYLFDQELKVFNLAADQNIGGEEFQIRKQKKLVAAAPLQGKQIIRLPAKIPQKKKAMSPKKRVGIFLLMIAMGLLGYLVFSVIREYQDNNIYY